MPVSSVGSGILPNQTSLTGAMAQRAYGQSQPAVVAANEANDLPSVTASQPQESIPTSLGASGPIGSQTGIAAYMAIMNQQASTSMRIEA